MNVTAVESSTLAAVACDEALGILELEFCSRAVYRYFHVPSLMHEGLIASDSKGRYFNRAIRGQFRYEPVKESRTGLLEKV